MIKFGDNINFDNILEEVEAERQVKYSCPCSYETCKKYKLNDEWVDFIMYGDKNTRPEQGVQSIDWAHQDGVLYPDVEYRQEIFKRRFKNQLAIFESYILMILERKQEGTPPVNFDEYWTDAVTSLPNPNAVMFEQKVDGMLHISHERFYVDANFHEWMREILLEQGVQFYNPQTANFKGVKLLPGQNLNDIAAKTANFLHQLYFHPSLEDETKSEMGLDAGCLDLSEWDKLVKYIVDQLEGAPDPEVYTDIVSKSKTESLQKFEPYIKSGELVSELIMPTQDKPSTQELPTQDELQW